MRLFKDLPQNSRTCIMVEPFWAVFSSIIFFYAPIYMKSIGLTEIQMGFINTANMLAGFVFQFLGAPITNRLGRKKTSLVFDLVSWSVPMLIWAVAQNFWYFLAAYTINATAKVVMVSWFCLISEDAPQNKRARIFGAINIINYTTGIFTPVTGLLISRFGTVHVLRLVYTLGFVSMTFMFFLRNAYISETRTGTELMEKHSSLTVMQSIRIYSRNIVNLRRNKGLVLIIIIMFIMNLIYSMNFFQVLYIKECLGFEEKTLSFIPLMYAAVNLFLYFFVLPAFRRLPDEKLLAGSFFVSLAGSVLFLISPPKSLAFLMLSLAIIAVGNFVMQTYRDAVFLGHVGEYEKADVYAAAQMLTTLLCIPSGYLSGLMFSLMPRLPFLTVSALLMFCLVVSLMLVKPEKAVPVQRIRF